MPRTFGKTYLKMEIFQRVIARAAVILKFKNIK